MFSIINSIADAVPPKSELKTLDRAEMAIARVPKEVSESSAFIGEHGEFGRPLFAQLVPFAVHVAASIYEERRDRQAGRRLFCFEGEG